MTSDKELKQQVDRISETLESTRSRYRRGRFHFESLLKKGWMYPEFAEGDKHYVFKYFDMLPSSTSNFGEIRVYETDDKGKVFVDVVPDYVSFEFDSPSDAAIALESLADQLISPEHRFYNGSGPVTVRGIAG